MTNPIAIGIDIGGTNMKAGIVADDGAVLFQETHSTQATGKEALMIQILEVAAGLRERIRNEGWQLKGLGVGTAGYVNKEGIIGEATGNLPGWTGTRLQDELRFALGIPVMVDNDVNVMARGEMWLGAGKTLGDFVCVTLGTGVGGCFISGGQPYRGNHGYAGAYGHIAIETGGLPCTCGLKGCWEQYASVTALKRMIREMDQKHGTIGTTPIGLFESARSGHPAELVLVERYAANIATGLAALTHVFNPSAIVIGGAITAQGDFLFDRIRNQWKQQTMKAFSAEPCTVIPAVLGDQAGMIGAARMALEAAQ